MIAIHKQLTTMDILTSLKALRKKFRRKAQHKIYVYNSMLEMQNAAMRKLVRVTIKQDAIRKIRKSHDPSNVICSLSKENLHLLQSAGHNLSLCKKYKRYYKLLNY
tara:strand:- start:1129 stop:1446 length:318 start_codon:yes stop_codon:yes gene_type:complete